MRGQRPNWGISIHALLAESDRVSETLVPRQYQFLSTLSLRRATQAYSRHFAGVPEFLSTLSLRRATSTRQIKQTCRAISIHALLAESDSVFFIIFNASCTFLSTLSLRRATHFTNCTSITRPFLSTLSLRRATRALR